MYITDLYNEIKIWYKIRSIAKKAEPKLKESGFRVDWVGRIYTVINLPEEVVSAPIGIADYVSPEFNPIDDTNSFLLVLSPDREYLKLWPMIKSLFKTLGGLLILRILYLIFKSHGEKIIELWNQTITTIF